MEENSLWPKDFIQESKIIVPAKLMQEQAAILGTMTGGVIQGNVTSYRNPVRTPGSKNPEGVVHRFKIVAPRYGNYEFVLIKALQTSIFPYPISVTSPLTQKQYEVAEYSEFVEVLKEIFAAPETRKAINSLLAQSEDARQD